MSPSRRVYEFGGLAVASDISLPQLRRSRAPARCVITRPTARSRLADISWFHQWRKPRGPRWLSFGRHQDGYVLRFEDLADFVLSADATQISARPSPRLPIETLRHLLIDQVLPLALSRHGRVALHASAVHIAGFGTIGFAGETGRGKSTLAAAFAAQGAGIVTDDCLALDAPAGRPAHPRVRPGYPGLRLWPGRRVAGGASDSRGSRVAHYSSKQRIASGLTFHARPSALRALFLLAPRASTGAAATMQQCRASAKMIALLRFAYVLDVEDRAHLGALFGRLWAVAQATPVMRLRVREGARYLPAATALIQRFAAGA